MLVGHYGAVLTNTIQQRLLALLRKGSGKSDEYVLCVESALFTNEYETLVREIELFVGRDVHKMGADPVNGRYVHDILTDSGKSA